MQEKLDFFFIHLCFHEIFKKKSDYDSAKIEEKKPRENENK